MKFGTGARSEPLDGCEPFCFKVCTVREPVPADPLGHLTFGVGHLITENDEEYGKEVGTPVAKRWGPDEAGAS